MIELLDDVGYTELEPLDAVERIELALLEPVDLIELLDEMWFPEVELLEEGGRVELELIEEVAMIVMVVRLCMLCII